MGILASLGLTQYSTVVEKSRLAGAKVRIGLMRQLATEYYINNGTLAGILDSDVGADNTCSSATLYAYWIQSYAPGIGWVNLAARRCNSSRWYIYYLQYYPGTGMGTWHCAYADDGSSCFGLPP